MRKLLLVIAAMFVWIGVYSQPYNDDFESYTVGLWLAGQNPTWWTTWSGAVNGPEDGQISTAFAHSGTKSVVADEVPSPGTDQVLKLGDLTTGKYDLKWWMYVETGYCGYYNIQHMEAPGIEWAFEVYFRANGDIELLAGTVAPALPFVFPGGSPKDTWFEARQLIDIDADLITLIINGYAIHQWPFHYQGGEITGTNQLGGVDLYAGAKAGTSELPKFFWDDVSFTTYVPTPAISIAPTSLTSTIPTNTTETQLLTVSNTGTANITFTTSGAPAWLTVSPAAGTVYPIDTNVLNVTFNAIGLAVGTYNGSFDIVSNDPTTPTINVPVTLTVESVACAAPTLITATFITYSSANIGWTGDIGTYQIDYAIGAHVGGTGTIITGVGTNPYPLTGLSPVSNYYVYVRQDCGLGSYSTWSGPVIFTTLEQYSTIVYPVTGGTGYVSAVTGTKKGPWMNISTTANDTSGRGFVKFDLSSLPANAIISKGTMNYYNFYREGTSAGANNIYPLAFDPLTTNGGLVWADCTDGGSLWSGAWGGTAPMWFTSVLSAAGATYLNDQLNSGWAGFGITRSSTFLYRMSGDDDVTYKPTLQIDYHVATTPVFSVAPASMDFEEVNLGIQSLSQVFRIKNYGVGTIMVDALVLEGVDAGQFVLTDGAAYPKVLGAGASYTVSVLFMPNAIGVKTANLRITENETDHTVPLTGTGYLNAPRNLTATPVYGPYVNLTWEAPMSMQEIRYDNNVVTNFLWFTPPSTINQRMYTKITIPVNGTMTNIGMMTRAQNAPSAWETITLCPDNGGVPNLAAPIETWSSVMVNSLSGEWILKTLTTPLAVTAGQNYYIVAQWTAASSNGPLIAYDGHNSHARCGYTSTGGALWTLWAGNFFMRAYMTIPDDKSNTEPIVLTSGGEVEGMEDLPVVSVNAEPKVLSGPAPAGLIAPAVLEPLNPNRSFTNYTLNRGEISGTWTDTWTGLTGTAFQDVTVTPSTQYYYMVTAVYSNGTANSNIAGVTSWATCPAPVDLNVTGITANSANLAWTEVGLATSWEYVYGLAPLAPPAGSGTATSSTSVNPISGLTFGTAYQFYVRSNCGTEFSTWAGPFSFNTPLCDAVDQCVFTVDLTDSYGDGWNGAVLGFRQGGIVVGTFGTGFTSGSTYGPENITLCDAMSTEIMVVNAGSYPEECGFVVRDPLGNIIFTHPAGLVFNVATIFFTFTSDCNPVPANYTATGTVGAGQTQCFNATNTITVGGGPAFTVESTGSATFIAGVNIMIMPGTTVMSGGYMLGKISTTYCGDGPLMPTVVGDPVNNPPSLEKAWFTIYPNPTNGNFTLVQKGERQLGNVRIDVYGMRGEKVLTSQMIGEKQHEFVTSALPTGLYFVKIVADDYTEIIKLIKTR